MATSTEINHFTYGERIRGVFTVVDFQGSPVDPTTVKFHILTPSSVVTVYEYGVDPDIVNDSVGVYHIDIDTDEEGAWKYRWEGSGNVATATEGIFYVDDSPFV